MDSYTRKLLEEISMDEDSRTYQVSEDEEEKYFDSNKTLICRNLNNMWLLSAHGEEDIRYKNYIYLRPNEIVIMPTNPGMPVPNDFYIDDIRNKEPIEFINFLKNREYRDKITNSIFRYNIDYMMFSGNKRDTKIPNISIIKSKDSEFESGLYHMPIERISSFYKIKQKTLLSEYITKLRKINTNGFILFVSTCRASKYLEGKKMGQDDNTGFVITGLSYDKLRRKMYTNPVSKQYLDSGFKMKHLYRIVNSIVEDTNRDDLGCIGNLRKNSFSDFNYRDEFLSKRGKTEDDIDRAYFEMQGIDLDDDSKMVPIETSHRVLERAKSIREENKFKDVVDDWEIEMGRGGAGGEDKYYLKYLKYKKKYLELKNIKKNNW